MHIDQSSMSYLVTAASHLLRVGPAPYRLIQLTKPSSAIRSAEALVMVRSSGYLALRL